MAGTRPLACESRHAHCWTVVMMSESPASWIDTTPTLWRRFTAIPSTVRIWSVCHLPSSTLLPSKWSTFEPPRIALYSRFVRLIAGVLFAITSSLQWPCLRFFWACLKPKRVSQRDKILTDLVLAGTDDKCKFLLDVFSGSCLLNHCAPTSNLAWLRQ